MQPTQVAVIPLTMSSRFVSRSKLSPGHVQLRHVYSLGQFAKNLTWYFTDLLLAYYVNVRIGLSAPQTGLLLFLSLALGGLIDIFAAFLLRRAEGRLRTILLVQFAAGLATACALLAIFFPISGTGLRFLFLLIVLGAFRLAYAFYDVSQNALLSLLPEDDEEAYQYVVWRQVLSGVARLAVAGSAFLLVGAQVPRGGEVMVAGVIALLIALTAVWPLRWNAIAARRPVTAHQSLWLVIPAGLPRLLLAGAALAGPLAMISRMVAFVSGPPPDDHAGATLLFTLVLGTVLGSVTLPRRRGRLPGLAFTLAAVLAAALFLVAPRPGPFAQVACLAYGIGLGGLTTLFWREMSAAIRDHAEQTGQRTDITAFAALTATAKLSGALSGAGLGLLLDGFKAGAPSTSICLTAIAAAGGACFVLAIGPILPPKAGPFYRRSASISGLPRATPPPGSRTT